MKNMRSRLARALLLVCVTVLSNGAGVAPAAPPGTVTELSTGISAGSGPVGIAAGPDGNLWFAERANRIARITSGMPIDSPVISGLPQVGRPLSCTPGIWSATLTAISRQWLRAGSPIPGATGPTYTTVADDLGRQLSCRITASFAAVPTPASADSAPITIAAAETGLLGPQGQPGTNGATGPTGATGAQGAAGPAGPAGQIELVTCKTVTKSVNHHTSQQCTAKVVSGPVKFTTSNAIKATVSRAGHIYATGIATRHHNQTTLRLISRRRLTPGRYRLNLTYNHKTTHTTLTIR